MTGRVQRLAAAMLPSMLERVHALAQLEGPRYLGPQLVTDETAEDIAINEALRLARKMLARDRERARDERERYDPR